MRPFEPLPIDTTPYTSPAHYLPPTEHERRRSELANAEAALAEMMNALDVARAGIEEANRTSTAPVMSGSRVLLPGLRFSPERMRERKSYAFRLFNRRRGEVAAARRRVDAARATLGLPTLASVEKCAATRRLSAPASGSLSPTQSRFNGRLGSGRDLRAHSEAVRRRACAVGA